MWTARRGHLRSRTTVRDVRQIHSTGCPPALSHAGDSRDARGQRSVQPLPAGGVPVTCPRAGSGQRLDAQLPTSRDTQSHSNTRAHFDAVITSRDTAIMTLRHPWRVPTTATSRHRDICHHIIPRDTRHRPTERLGHTDTQTIKFTSRDWSRRTDWSCHTHAPVLASPESTSCRLSVKHTHPVTLGLTHVAMARATPASGNAHPRVRRSDS